MEIQVRKTSDGYILTIPVWAVRCKENRRYICDANGNPQHSFIRRQMELLLEEFSNANTDFHYELVSE